MGVDLLKLATCALPAIPVENISLVPRIHVEIRKMSQIPHQSEKAVVGPAI